MQLKANRPQLIVGLGGFASFPTCLAARSHGIPLALLEQNVVPGRSVRFLARRAGLVCGSFEETAAALGVSQNYVVTGNPVRSAIAALHSRAESSDDRQTLLILGGSQGAESLNTAVLGLLERGLMQRWGGPIVHQTGLADEARVREGYATSGVTATVSAFIDDLQPHYDAAALAIARAGATTLAELACAGCPAILLPYPHAADNHQLRNAQWYARQGAAIVVEQAPSAEATTAHLASAWEPLSTNPVQRATMRLAMARCARPNAASAVVETLLNRLWGTGPVS
jgi:UDP-N-acetylglucosamine--N-acetylmuramyl-(pentapeptide) pyrophosphoryl-undecaprenol N-acetylglucosamine transferase